MYQGSLVVHNMFVHTLNILTTVTTSFTGLFGHLVNQPKSLYNHALSVIVSVGVTFGITAIVCTVLLATWLDKETVFGVNMYTCP